LAGRAGNPVVAAPRCSSGFDGGGRGRAVERAAFFESARITAQLMDLLLQLPPGIAAQPQA